MEPRRKLRKSVKRIVAPHPRIYRFLVGAYHLYHYSALPFVRRALRRRPAATGVGEDIEAHLPRQAVLGFEVETGSASRPEALRDVLTERGIEFQEGAWTFYLPPQRAVDRLCPFLKQIYPPDCGLKILKDFAPPHEACYTRHDLNPSPGMKKSRAQTPAPVALVRVANHLHVQGLGPRVWDVARLWSGEQSYTAYVVQHVRGRRPTSQECEGFLRRLERELVRGELCTVHGRIGSAKDFAPPDCNGNLIFERDSNCALYVDWQSFRLSDEARVLAGITVEEVDAIHFGGTRRWRGGAHYPYQSIPGLVVGKRDMALRWEKYRTLFEDVGVAFNNRVVYDIGCNTGLMLANALSAGAVWGLGWDIPDVVGAAHRILVALGATRYDLIPERICAETNFLRAVPQRLRDRGEGVLFYLAVSNHIGFPPSVSELSWRYMLYEGHAGQSIAGERDHLASVPWLRDAGIVATDLFSDGDTPARPVILLERRTMS